MEYDITYGREYALFSVTFYAPFSSFSNNGSWYINFPLPDTDNCIASIPELVAVIVVKIAYKAHLAYTCTPQGENA